MVIKNSVLLFKSRNLDNSEDGYEKILTENNFSVEIINPLGFEFKNLDVLKKKLETNDDYSGLIFTSPRCAEAVILASENDNFMDRWNDKNNFVVGEATYKIVLEKLGLTCNGKDTGNALNLSLLIIQNKSLYNKPFLFPCGNLKSDTLHSELSKEGLGVDDIEVYDVTSNPNIEKEIAEATNNFASMPEFVVFFSPSGFSNTIDIIKKASDRTEKLKFIAIGPTTERAILEQNFTVHGVAKQPKPNDILKVILNR
ncbi:hypothetical protein GWI33_007325 [Rhynchophorus ferrugineus]|uniref:Uroporphyrinogen-III synthase n=1 Tax=Rhynchophorus ferrugineus TaxID=354439 RepID=A0A834IK20_RHYFE|nr:hypothetical protein GWI33_007325 [Rhynchophorus ferrugineus]